MEKLCKYCGKILYFRKNKRNNSIKRNKKNDFCNDKCKYKFHKENKVKLIKIKICDECKKEFETNTLLRRYCSKKCLKDKLSAEHYKKIGKPIIEDRKCKECKSLNILYRVKTNTFICRVCGHVWGKK